MTEPQRHLSTLRRNGCARTDDEPDNDYTNYFPFNADRPVVLPVHRDRRLPSDTSETGKWPLTGCFYPSSRSLRVRIQEAMADVSIVRSLGRWQGRMLPLYV